MGCGQLRVSASFFQQAPHISARILAWAGADADLVKTSLVQEIAFLIPQSIFKGKGPLRLIEGGHDLTQLLTFGTGFGQERMWHVGSGEVASITDPDHVPTIGNVSFKSDGMTLSLDVSRPATIDWGDGTQDTSAEHHYDRETVYLVQAYNPGQTEPRSEMWVRMQHLCGRGVVL